MLNGPRELYRNLKVQRGIRDGTRGTIGAPGRVSGVGLSQKGLKVLGKVRDGTANHGSTRRSQVPQLAKTARALATWGGVGRAVVCSVGEGIGAIFAQLQRAGTRQFGVGVSNG